ncbi:MAG: ferrous iron transport protein A [Clostridia bacterium]|nr:ferrous iron transport protein A [Clostridia bacterium]
MPIALAPVGQDLKVLKITADEETKRHLEDIGITVNSVIQVISRSGRTSICLVKNSRLALDSNLSMKILVA